MVLGEAPTEELGREIGINLTPLEPDQIATMVEEDGEDPIDSVTNRPSSARSRQGVEAGGYQGRGGVSHQNKILELDLLLFTIVDHWPK